MVDRVGLAEGTCPPVAVHAGTGGVNEARRGRQPAGRFEPVDRPDDVDLGVQRGVDDARSDPSARGKVRDRLGLDLLDQASDAVGIADVQLDQTKPGGPERAREVRLLKLGGVIRVEVIDRDDIAALAQEAVHQRRADKPGASGDDRRHVTSHP